MHADIEIDEALLEEAMRESGVTSDGFFEASVPQRAGVICAPGGRASLIPAVRIPSGHSKSVPVSAEAARLRRRLERMRLRASHLTCLLLLLSSLAVSAHASNVASTRTPGDVFIHNLLLQAGAVEEAEPAGPDFPNENRYAVTASTPHLWNVAYRVPGPAAHTAHVHAVTGSSL
jgi:hypothetical protein